MQIFPPVHQRQLLISSDTTDNLITEKTFWDLSGLFLNDKRTPIPKKDLRWEDLVEVKNRPKKYSKNFQKF